MTCGIYKITNTVNDKCYIGQSVNIEVRLKSHFAPSKDDSYFKRAIVKYGKGAFVCEVLLVCDEDSLNYYERECIRVFNTFGQGGYNLTTGGHDQHHRAESTGKLISEKLKLTWADPIKRKAILDKVQSDEVKIKRGESISRYYRVTEGASETLSRAIRKRFENPEYAAAHKVRMQALRDNTEIESRRIEATRNYWRVPENKERGVAALQKARTPEAEARRLEAVNEFLRSERSTPYRQNASKRLQEVYDDPIRGDMMRSKTQESLTPEVIARRTESVKKFWTTEKAAVFNAESSERNKKNLSVPIVCIETQERFNSMSDAGRWLIAQGRLKCLHSGKLGEVCEGLRKSLGGYTWAYA